MEIICHNTINFVYRQNILLESIHSGCVEEMFTFTFIFSDGLNWNPAINTPHQPACLQAVTSIAKYINLG